MNGQLITLKADNKLLNPNFDGYKLSNIDVRAYSKKLQDGKFRVNVLNGSTCSNVGTQRGNYFQC